MNANAILIFVGLIGVAFVGYVYLSYSQSYASMDPQLLSGVTTTTLSSNAQPQDVYLKALASGTYDKQELRVRLGQPVRLHFSTEQGVGCGAVLVIRDLGVQAYSKNGAEEVVTFTPQKKGSFAYTCSMRMFQPGALIVE